MTQVNTQKIADALEQLNAKITMFADGFVDEVWEIVNARIGPEDFTVYSRMNQFAERITHSGTGGVGLELVKKRRAFGGFTANIGFAAARLGVDTAMVGVYGKDNLDSVFEPVSDICHVISLGDPAITHVFEFDDGKILMSHMEAVQGISWGRIVDVLGVEKIHSLLAESDIIGVGYWSLLPAFDEIVEGVCEYLPQDGKTRRFFFDFADFLKKDEASLKSTLSKLESLNKTIPLSLSLNEHEAAALFAMRNETLDDTGRPIQEKLEDVRGQLGFDELIVHTPYYAAAASLEEKCAFVAARFCTKPVRSAGAGDSFNGGYIAARLAGLDIYERLHTANAAVGFFLRNAEFPDTENMITQLN